MFCTQREAHIAGAPVRRAIAPRAQRKKRGGKPYSWSRDEEVAALENHAPGSKPYAILSFRSAFHGRAFGALSATRSKAAHKLDVPQFDWPCADFPRYRYPLEQHEDYNRQQDARCLEQVCHAL